MERNEPCDCRCNPTTNSNDTSCCPGEPLLLYRGVKTVYAAPMNEEKAIEKGFARENTDGHILRPGYYVLYPDGYGSWSPEIVFENAYKPAETFRDRLIIERDELNEKLRNLIKFLDDVEKAESPSLDGRDMELMNFQRKMMQAYLDVLNERIGRAF